MARWGLSVTTTLTVAGAMLGMTAILHLTLMIGMHSQLRSFERARAQHAIERLHYAAQSLPIQLADKVRDWAIFDDSYQFMAEASADYIKANLTDETTDILSIDWIAYFTADGELYYLFLGPQLRDSDSTALINGHLAEVAPADRIKQLTRTQQAFAGFFQGFDGRLFMAAMHPILRSTGEGPARGMLLFASSLSDDHFQHIASLVSDPVIVTPLAGRSKKTQIPWEDLSSHPGSRFALSNNTLASTLIYDAQHQPVSRATVDLGPGIRHTNTHIQNYLLASQVAMALLSGLMLLLILRRRVIKRLSSLQQQLAQIAHHGSTGQRVSIHGNDEIGALANNINTTLLSLDHARQEAERHSAQAESANQAKTAFLSNLSHEIRSPLHGIMGMAQILNATLQDDRARDQVEAITSCSESLLALLNESLDLAKVEAGQLTFDPQSLAVATLLHRSLEAFRPQLRNEVQLLAHLSEQVPQRLNLDGLRIRQILINLVSNALKFTHHGQVTVYLDYQSATDDQQTGTLQLRVHDTGIGMNDDQVRRLFQPFSQVQGSKQNAYGGTGLGLALCHRLVLAMGGRIGADSQPEVGSTLWCDIPCAPVTSPSDDPGAPSAPLLIAAIGPSLADGDSIGHGLRAAGHAVEHYPDPSLLHSHLRSTAHSMPPDLVIIDLDMTDEFYAQLRQPWRQQQGLPPRLLFIAPSQPRRHWLQALPRCPLRMLTRHRLDCSLQGAITELVAESGAPPSGQSERPFWKAPVEVLVVDDSLLNRRLLRHQLESLGLRVREASDGHAAISAWQHHDPALIIMDGRMPGLDGFSASQHIRQAEAAQETQPHIPIIGLSADVMGDIAFTAQQSGMDQLLSKPCDEQTLIKAICTFLPPSGYQAQTSIAIAAQTTPPDSHRHTIDALVETLGREPAQDILRSLLQELARLMAQLHSALEQGNASACDDAAHTLTGTLATLGFARLAESIRPLMQWSRSQSWDQLQQRVPEVTAEIDHLVQTIEAWLSADA